MNIENIFYEKGAKRIWISETNKTFTEQNNHLSLFKHDLQTDGIIYCLPKSSLAIKIATLGIVPFVTTPFKGHFVVFYNSFLLFIATVGSSNPVAETA